MLFHESFFLYLFTAEAPNSGLHHPTVQSEKPRNRGFTPALKRTTQDRINFLHALFGLDENSTTPCLHTPLAGDDLLDTEAREDAGCSDGSDGDDTNSDYDDRDD